MENKREKAIKVVNKNNTLPDYFKNVLWSYNFEKVDPNNMARIIIINSINYGNLNHWRWILDYYGRDEVFKIVDDAEDTEIRPGVRKLLNLMSKEENEKV